MTLNKKQLTQKLLDGEKLTPTGYAKTSYCMYDDSKRSPFILVRGYDTENREMVNAWNETEWETYKEPNQFWEPTNGEISWYTGSNEIIHSDNRWKNPGDLKIIKTGNVFETKEQAEKVVAYRKAEYRLRKAIFELNDGPSPEFVTYGDNWTVNIDDKQLCATSWIGLQAHQDWFYLKSEELCEKLIESHKDDLLIYLHGV